MHATIHGERTLTELDHVRLSKLSDGQLPPALADLLATADVVRARDMPGDVITMLSQVELVDAHSQRRQMLTLCYPADAEPSAGFISVLSPVGCSLLGLKTGAVATWQTPCGEASAARVVAIPFQPEASGDYLS
ncbi:MAG: GreA/GreB family elongation factor [Pseudomonadota bacterium]